MRSLPVAAAGPQCILLLVGLLAVVFGVACTSDDEAPRAAGFYAEIGVEVELSPDDYLARYRRTESQGVIRWWYATDPVRWRWEIEGVGGIIDDGLMVTVFDGTDSWWYDDRPNTYVRRAAPDPPGAVPSPFFSAPVGPANADTIDVYMERWRTSGGIADVARAGEATILGRETQIIELHPASGGITSVFIDPERMFIMRWASDGGPGAQSYSAEVTVLDYDTAIDARLFVFDPPAGSREVEDSQGCRYSGSSVIGASFPAEDGFLVPSYTPSGYRPTGVSSEASASGDCRRTATSVLLESPDGAYILIEQRLRAGGIPDTVRAWEPVDSDLGEVYHRSEEGITRLVWRSGEVVALLEADAVPLEELLRIAESSELAP